MRRTSSVCVPTGSLASSKRPDASVRLVSPVCDTSTMASPTGLPLSLSTVPVKCAGPRQSVSMRVRPRTDSPAMVRNVVPSPSVKSRRTIERDATATSSRPDARSFHVARVETRRRPAGRRARTIPRSRTALPRAAARRETPASRGRNPPTRPRRSRPRSERRCPLRAPLPPSPRSNRTVAIRDTAPR